MNFRVLNLWLAMLTTLAVGGLNPGAVAAPPPARSATAAELAMLSTALEQTAREMGRWAYTETRVVRGEKGQVKSDVVVRYDPSKPYGEQWTPLSVDGRPPTASDHAKYRRQGERAGRQEARGESSRRYSLGELLEVGRSRVAAVTPRQIVYEIPLRAERNNRFPPEKFEVLAWIDRDPAALRRISLRLRESFRSKLVINVKSGEGSLEFEAVHPEHPPTLTQISGGASASVFFVSVGGELDLKRTDFKRVKPYAERFEVQIGALKAIDF
jgi:hypothetical protein